jgi:hypothetical protein
MTDNSGVETVVLLLLLSSLFINVIWSVRLCTLYVGQMVRFGMGTLLSCNLFLSWDQVPDSPNSWYFRSLT